MPRLQTLILLYTDPGAGALVWQLLLAALFGGLFYARRFRDRLFARRRPRAGDDPAGEPPAPPGPERP